MNYNDISKWLKSLNTAPAKWRRRSHTKRMLLTEAFIFLGIARLAVIVLPLGKSAFIYCKQPSQ